MSELFDLHPSRADGKPQAFVFKSARHLRANQTWNRFLDSIHISHEHVFFADAHMGAFAHEVTNVSAFEAEQIRMRWSEQLKTFFGRQVIVKATKR